VRAALMGEDVDGLAVRVLALAGVTPPRPPR
jgi:hypothetical protein